MKSTREGVCFSTHEGNFDLSLITLLLDFSQIGYMGGVDTKKTAENLSTAKAKYSATRQKATKAQRKREKSRMAASALTFRPGSHRYTL